MYNFVDTTQTPAESRQLPAEALQINGEYIENQIEGYQTLYVTGRELSESEINETQIGNATGTEYQGKRNVQRTITVGFQLLCSTPEEFTEKFNTLNGILDVEQARLIFRDEPDKYYIGTKSEVGDIPSGRLNVKGEFAFYCCDPYKYSAAEKTFQASLNAAGIMEVSIQNDGTAPAVISYDIKHNHENGFVGIASEYGAMQYGKVDEIDSETLQRSEELFRYSNPTEFGAMTNGQGVLTEDFPKNGTWRTVTYQDKPYLALDNVGSGSSWHGASKMVTLPQDSSGSNVAQNFLCQTRVWFEAGRPSQTGLLEFVIGDEDNNLLASIHIIKTSTNSGSARVIMKIADEEVERIEFTANGSSPVALNAGQLYIRKSGELFEFYYHGKHSFRRPSLAEKKAKSVTIFLGQHGSRGSSANDLVTRMYFDYLFFRKDNVNYENDIPNRYPAGSTLHIDGYAGKAYLDGVDCTGDEILGTRYFKAPPGETEVQFLYSDFSDPPPTITATIKEAWL